MVNIKREEIFFYHLLSEDEDKDEEEEEEKMPYFVFGFVCEFAISILITDFSDVNPMEQTTYCILIERYFVVGAHFNLSRQSVTVTSALAILTDVSGTNSCYRCYCVVV